MRTTGYAYLALALLAATAAAVEPPKDLDQWASASGRNFKVYLEKRTLDPTPVAAAVDDFWRALASEFQTQPIEMKQVPVYAFEGQGRFEDFLVMNGRPKTASGWCHAGDGTPFIATSCRDLGVDDAVWANLRHEGTHLYLLTHVPDGKALPQWINEGLATYYSHARIADGKVTDVSIVAGDLYGMQGAIRVGTAERLKKHLARRDGVHWDANRTLQSWSVAYWLMQADNGAKLEAVRRYVMSAGAEKDTVAHFERVFGMKIAQAEVAWKKFTLALKPGEGGEKGK
jgi:hypothetical protein